MPCVVVGDSDGVRESWELGTKDEIQSLPPVRGLQLTHNIPFFS